MSALSPAARALIHAGVSLAHDDGPGFIAAFRAHDWKTVARDVVEGELPLAAAVPGPQQAAAAIALKLLPVGIAVLAYAASHPGAAHQPEGSGAFTGA